MVAFVFHHNHRASRGKSRITCKSPWTPPIWKNWLIIHVLGSGNHSALFCINAVSLINNNVQFSPLESPSPMATCTDLTSITLLPSPNDLSVFLHIHSPICKSDPVVWFNVIFGCYFFILLQDSFQQNFSIKAILKLFVCVLYQYKHLTGGAAIRGGHRWRKCHPLYLSITAHRNRALHQ